MESVIQQSCFTCDFRPDRIFCDMPADSLQAFDEIKSLATYPAEHDPVRRRAAGSRHLSTVRWPSQAFHLCG